MVSSACVCVLFPCGVRCAHIVSLVAFSLVTDGDRWFSDANRWVGEERRMANAEKKGMAVWSVASEENPCRGP